MTEKTGYNPLVLFISFSYYINKLSVRYRKNAQNTKKTKQPNPPVPRKHPPAVSRQQAAVTPP